MPFGLPLLAKWQPTKTEWRPGSKRSNESVCATHLMSTACTRAWQMPWPTRPQMEKAEPNFSSLAALAGVLDCANCGAVVQAEKSKTAKHSTKHFFTLCALPFDLSRERLLARGSSRTKDRGSPASYSTVVAGNELTRHSPRRSSLLPEPHKALNHQKMHDACGEKHKRHELGIGPIFEGGQPPECHHRKDREWPPDHRFNKRYGA